jgi:hypothetical protein|tara:strand:- start:446 stop:574 length:129 start_codon:yes stop_codon:yes gene_type:complete
MEKIKKWWKRFNMSPIEKYLSESKDHYDLEVRQRELARKGIY